jgi:hypothetical protein
MAVTRSGDAHVHLLHDGARPKLGGRNCGRALTGFVSSSMVHAMRWISTLVAGAGIRGHCFLVWWVRDAHTFDGWHRDSRP